MKKPTRSSLNKETLVALDTLDRNIGEIYKELFGPFPSRAFADLARQQVRELKPRISEISKQLVGTLVDFPR